jgi:hypothetical protein
MNRRYKPEPTILVVFGRPSAHNCHIMHEAGGLGQRQLTATSWSVEYMGDAYDDARMVAGRWYFRSILSGEFQDFPFQKRVVPLRKNPQLQLVPGRLSRSSAA